MLLKRWQWIAIVLSIIWAVSGGAYEWSVSTTRAHSRALAEYESCIEINVLTHNPALNLCAQRASRVFAVELKGLWRCVVIVIVTPLAVVWTVTYLLLTGWRATHRG